jgi:hypothetical protein
MITTVRNSAQFLKALKAAHSGDTILLAAGTYAPIAISGISFASGVTIASADPTHEAVLTGLTVTNSSGLNFQQLNLTTTTGTAATISGSSNITFSQDAFSGSGGGVGNAMMLQNSGNITVTGSSFSNFGTGINAMTDKGLTITNNTFHGITGGAVRGTAVTSSTISGNTFTDAITTVPTHTDVLYLWQDNTANNVTISNNFYGPPLPAVLTTTTQLIEALQNAHAGQVIQLAAGVYDAAAISNFQFTTPVTITSADPTHEAVLSNLTVSSSSGLIFQGVTVSTATGTAATVTGSQNIAFSGDTFSGTGSSTGGALTVSGSSGVTVTGSDFGNFATGINATTDSNLSVAGNTFHNIAGGDVVGSGVTNSTISGNTFANASSTNAAHTDVINLSQDNTANNVTIANNIFPAPPPPVVVTPPPPPPPTPSPPVSVSTNAQLLAADLQNAHAGDVIKLAAGTYDGAVLNNLHFANNVTITSADPTHEAVISNLTVSNSSGLLFQGVTLTTSTGTAVAVSGSQGMGFSQDTFSGPGAGTGTALSVSGSSGVTVTGSDVGNFGTGLNLQTDSTVTVTGNNFHGNPGGAIVGSGVTASVINGNTFPDASATNTAHTDVINLTQGSTPNQVEINGNAFGTAHIVAVNSVQQLAAALQTAHGGDVIELAAGTYDAVALGNLNFATPVTIMSADPNNHAVLSNLTVEASGITLADVTLTTGTGYAVTIDSSSHMTFDHDTFVGTVGDSSLAMMVRTSDTITVSNSTISNFSNTGINLLTDNNVAVTNDVFTGNAGNDVRGTAITNSTISGNTFADADPTVTSHTDVLNFWTLTTPNSITLSNNTFGSGATATTPPTTTTTTTPTTTTTTTTTTPTTPSSIVATGTNSVQVSNVNDLMTALQTAHAGETIQLAAGAYNNVTINNLVAPGVTITSADQSHQAVINGLTINSSSNLTFDHLQAGFFNASTIQPQASAVQEVYLGNASNISFSNMTFNGISGAYAGNGIYAVSTNGLSVTNSSFGQSLRVGITNQDSTNIVESHNSFQDLGGDGIDNAGSSQMVFDGNTFTSFNTIPGVHPDAIQFWAGSTGVNGSNIVVENNVISRGSGNAFQGIFVEHTNNIEIVGNAIAGSMIDAISLSTTTHALIENNLVDGFTDISSAAIVTRGQSSNVSLVGNTSTYTGQILDGGLPNPGYSETGTTIIPSANVGDYSAFNAWLASHTPATNSLSDAFFLS